MAVPVSLKEVTKILSAYPGERRYTLAVLQDFQRRFGYVPREAMEAASSCFGIRLSALYSMVTFYRALSLKPKGKYIIRVCDGTACHIRGAPALLDSLKRALKIAPGETTKDGLFTLETVNCVGACAIAPVMVVNEDYHPKVKPDEIEKILAVYRGKKNGKN